MLENAVVITLSLVATVIYMRFMFRKAKQDNDLQMAIDLAPNPPPVPNESRPVWDVVVEQMNNRDQFGRRKYGKPLQANNERRTLLDAFEESLDLCVYLAQELMERGELK